MQELDGEGTNLQELDGEGTNLQELDGSPEASLSGLS
jgi:hypothetical protein